MADELRTELRLTLSLALTMIPRGTRREYSEKLLIRSDPAKDTITNSLIEALLSRFKLEPLPEVGVRQPIGSPVAGLGRY